MANRLRAIVLGAGHAGQGHALGLRYAGVDVVGMFGRTQSQLARAAQGLRIPQVSTDWRALLAETRPDVVAIATPGGTHREMIEAALDAKCHVVSEKPLATTAADAKALYERARDAGVKTAYAATFWYQPQVLYSRMMVESGAIGRVLEVESLSHPGWPSVMPFGWPHLLAEGGGRLNNGFPHLLAIVQHVLGGEVLSAMGEARNDLRQVPIGGGPKEFRDFAHRGMNAREAERWKWAEVDSDWSFTAIVRMGDPRLGAQNAASCTFRHSALRHAWPDDYVAIYGDRGTIHIRGAYATGGVYLKTDGPTWEQVGLPPDIRDQLPEEENDSLRNWMCLARDFVCDIQGLEVPRYLTFRDGWLYQEVIDAVREGTGWKALPSG